MMSTPDTGRGRLKRLLALLLVLLAAGLLYALLLSAGIGIGCPIRRLTGFLCPGCGVSRMCLSLLRGDLASAWSYNPAIMCCLPLGAAVAVDISIRYVKEGTKKTHKWGSVLELLIILVLLIHGVLRNL